jgi:transcriptional regulator with XRE-family HTH domain
VATFQQQREDVGLRLRELRRDARMTGRQLAERAGWHPSKVSKIEAGRQTPTDADVEAWTAAIGRPELTGEFIALLRTLEEHYVQFRRMFRTGMASRQRAIAEIEAGATVVRNFETTFVPGLLQTPEYARCRLAEAMEYDGAGDDLDTAVYERMRRQQVLYQTGKRHHFVVTEAALRYRLCPVDVLAGQLDRLINLSTMARVRCGVIPFEVAYPVAPVHGFWIYDERLVFVENLTAELKLTQPTEIAAHLRLFERLADVAWYGQRARGVVRRALEDLAT